MDYDYEALRKWVEERRKEGILKLIDKSELQYLTKKDLLQQNNDTEKNDIFSS